MREYQNALEPTSILDAFVHYPPEYFIINEPLLKASGIISFFADFNLLTTLEDAAKKWVDKISAFRFFRYLIKKMLTPNVLFVGTSISEYCVFPESGNPHVLVEQIISSYQQSNRPLLIVKDIPQGSTLLTQRENENADKLIQLLKEKGLIIVTGQALAYLEINFSSFEHYLAKLSAVRRKDFRRKMKYGAQLKRIEIKTGDTFFSDTMVQYFYDLYIHVFERSDIHFDRLSLAFFSQIFQQTDDGYVFVYYHQDKIIGFNLCYIIRGIFVDKYWGVLEPEAKNLSLFYNMSFDNIAFCLQHGLKKYVLGYTAPSAKASLGCDFTYTYHAIYIRNPLLRFILNRFKSFFEGDKSTLRKLVATN